ncbi:hypothetical protein BGX21_010284 [Mortierella sp. AD011]|nr:hypothetical protein BGX20_010209 [Mortierella sp. AD010]KAF9394624.1 hypothetical protein BGX21_010284 [Mortierella sp. AD011]
MPTYSLQRKPTTLFILLLAILTILSLVRATDAAPTRRPSTAKRAKRNPFLIHNVEATGVDSSHQDLAQSLGVFYSGNKRIDSVLGGRGLHGDDHKAQEPLQYQRPKESPKKRKSSGRK